VHDPCLFFYIPYHCLFNVRNTGAPSGNDVGTEIPIDFPLENPQKALVASTGESSLGEQWSPQDG